jgi:Ser/Thr protein kinase RdoA (MazF antagonist)
MIDADAIAFATRAAEAWGQIDGEPRMIANRENAVFDLRFADGARAALRLHREGYQSEAAITSEMRLTEALADAGFACPWPMRTRSDEFVHRPEGGPLVSVITWVEGKALGAAGTRFNGRPQEQVRLYGLLGALLADLHQTADSVAPLDLDRPKWDADAFCSDAPHWGRYWENPALSRDDAALLLTARDAARERLAGRHDLGLIHADVLQENVLRQGQHLFLIDFDDCGFGFRPYDLGTALVQHVETPAYEPLKEALIDGYLQAGGALAEEDVADMPMWVMLRGLASAGWIISRAVPDDPRQGLYAERAVKTARAFLNG